MLSDAIEWIDVQIDDALLALHNPGVWVFAGVLFFAVWWRVRIIKRSRGEDTDHE